MAVFLTVLLLIVAIVVGAKWEYVQIQRRLGQALGRNYWRHRLTQISTEDLTWDDHELTTRDGRSATETTYVDPEAGKNAKFEESNEQQSEEVKVEVERRSASYRKPKRQAPTSPPSSKQITTSATIEMVSPQFESTKNPSLPTANPPASGEEEESGGTDGPATLMEDEIGAEGRDIESAMTEGGVEESAITEMVGIKESAKTAEKRQRRGGEGAEEESEMMETMGISMGAI